MRALLSGFVVGSDRGRRLFHLTRFRIFVFVGAAEILLESLLFDYALPRGLPNWQNPDPLREHLREDPRGSRLLARHDLVAKAAGDRRSVQTGHRQRIRHSGI